MPPYLLRNNNFFLFLLNIGEHLKSLSICLHTYTCVYDYVYVYVYGYWHGKLNRQMRNPSFCFVDLVVLVKGMNLFNSSFGLNSCIGGTLLTRVSASVRELKPEEGCLEISPGAVYYFCYQFF